MKKKESRSRPSLKPKHYPYIVPEYDGIGCDFENLSLIQDHIAKFIAPVSWVWCEIASSVIHLDVLVVDPTDTRPFYTLITSGMSQKPMTPTIPEVSNCKYSELVLFLPADWPLNENEMYKEENFWPISMIKKIALFPHLHNTWFWHGHTYSNQLPFHSSTPYSGALIHQASRLSKDFLVMPTAREERTFFHNLTLLHQVELDFYIDHGFERLVKALGDQKLNYIMDPDRPPAV